MTSEAARELRQQRKLVGGVIGDAEAPHLPCLAQPEQPGRGLLRRGQPVRPVDQQHIDLLDPQFAQGALDTMLKGGRGRIVVSDAHAGLVFTRHADAALGHDLHPLAQAGRLRERAAKEPFARVVAVDIGVIERGDAAFQRGLDLRPHARGRRAGGIVRQPPHAVGDAGDFGTTGSKRETAHPSPYPPRPRPVEEKTCSGRAKASPLRDMKLEGKAVLVTGSSGGIGAEIALRLAREGADVAVNYNSHPEGGDAIAQQIRDMGRKSVSIGANLASVQEVGRLVAQSIEGLGRLDLLVNNAGVEKNADFLDVAEADYDLVMNVNLKGVFFVTQAFVRHLSDTKRTGRIVNISSVHEELPFPHFTAYCASKGGMKMMMRNLAIELAPLGITINNVAPGAIETPINTKLLNDKDKLAALLSNIPLNRLGQPADVAGTVAFLLSDDASYITGSTVMVDGGLLWNYSEQ